MPHGTAQYAAQHIAATLIGGLDIIGNQKTHGAQMISDHAKARGIFLRRNAGGRLNLRDESSEQIGLIIIMRPLHHRGDALEPHAGINRRARQRLLVAVLLAVKLHEDEVPDFNKAIAILVGAARRASGDLAAVIVKNLRTRTARPHGTHRPEIIRAINAENPALIKARNLLPVSKSFIILSKNRDQQFLRQDV